MSDLTKQQRLKAYKHVLEKLEKNKKTRSNYYMCTRLALWCHDNIPDNKFEFLEDYDVPKNFPEFWSKKPEGIRKAYQVWTLADGTDKKERQARINLLTKIINELEP